MAARRGGRRVVGTMRCVADEGTQAPRARAVKKHLLSIAAVARTHARTFGESRRTSPAAVDSSRSRRRGRLCSCLSRRRADERRARVRGYTLRDSVRPRACVRRVVSYCTRSRYDRRRRRRHVYRYYGGRRIRRRRRRGYIRRCRLSRIDFECQPRRRCRLSNVTTTFLGRYVYTHRPDTNLGGRTRARPENKKISRAL